MKTNLRILKAKIKGLASEGSKVRKEIHLNSDSKKDNLWHVKRDIGKEARCHLLAYGFLRGKSYREMEPSSDLIFFGYKFVFGKVVLHTPAKYLLKLIHQHGSYFDGKKWTEEYLIEQIFGKTEEKKKAA